MTHFNVSFFSIFINICSWSAVALVIFRTLNENEYFTTVTVDYKMTVTAFRLVLTNPDVIKPHEIIPETIHTESDD